MDIARIVKRIEAIEVAKHDLKVERGILKGEIESSSTYRNLTQQIETLTAERKRLVYDNPEFESMQRKIKEAAEEVATLNEILSAELLQYTNETQATTIETPGKVYSIQVKATAKPSNQRSLFNGVVK